MTTCTVTNITRGVVLAQNALVPETPDERAMGLLAHDELLQGEGLVLLDCHQIHTVGMHFPIDVLFCDGRGRVKWATTCNPGTKFLGIGGAKIVVELPAGMIRESRTLPGDTIALGFMGQR